MHIPRKPASIVELDTGEIIPDYLSYSQYTYVEVVLSMKLDYRARFVYSHAAILLPPSIVLEARFFFEPTNLIRLLAVDLLIAGFFFFHLLFEFSGFVHAPLEDHGSILNEVALPLAEHLRI